MTWKATGRKLKPLVWPALTKTKALENVKPCFFSVSMEGVSMEDLRVEECEHYNQKTEEDAQMEEGEQNNKDMEVAPALISVHPGQYSVAVAVGSD